MPVGLPEKIQLEIVTPDGLAFSGQVDEITVPGLDGYLGILPGHAPLLSELKVGMISVRQGDRVQRYYCSWGFVEVLPDRVSVLAETTEKPEEIDVNQARQDKERAENLLRSKDPNTDYQSALDLYARANARLEVAEAS